MPNTWNCPYCNRSFRRKDQQHSCSLLQKEDLFTGRPPELKIVFDELLRKVSEFGSIREETLPGVHYIKAASTFLAIKVKKEFLEIEFYLSKHLEDPIVYKWFQTSKNRFVHVVRIDTSKDLTGNLMSWIHHSYKLISGTLTN